MAMPHEEDSLYAGKGKAVEEGGYVRSKTEAFTHSASHRTKTQRKEAEWTCRCGAINKVGPYCVSCGRRMAGEAEGPQAAGNAAARAQYLLGEACCDRLDYGGAFACFLRAAELGSLDAEQRLYYTLDNSFYSNQNWQENSRAAHRWAVKAAERGDAIAQCILGYIYSKTNDVVEKDGEKAFAYYMKSARQGCAHAQYNVGMICQSRPDVSFEWHMKAAVQGLDWAQFFVGEFYYRGSEYIKRDYALALEWYLKAAAQGHHPSETMVGEIYYYGRGVEQDTETAHEWYKKAASADPGARAMVRKIDGVTDEEPPTVKLSAKAKAAFDKVLGLLGLADKKARKDFWAEAKGDINWHIAPDSSFFITLRDMCLCGYQEYGSPYEDILSELNGIAGKRGLPEIKQDSPTGKDEKQGFAALRYLAGRKCPYRVACIDIDNDGGSSFYYFTLRGDEAEGFIEAVNNALSLANADAEAKLI